MVKYLMLERVPFEEGLHAAAPHWNPIGMFFLFFIYLLISLFFFWNWFELDSIGFVEDGGKVDRAPIGDEQVGGRNWTGNWKREMRR